MRVLVWNMGKAFRNQERHDDGWWHLLDRDDFDVALLQETQEPPAWTRDAFPEYVWRPKYLDAGRGKPWGTAIISRQLELEPFDPDDDYPWLKASHGSTAIARVHTNPTWLASVHLSHRFIPRSRLEQIGLGTTEVTTRNRKVFETNVIPDEMHRLFGDHGFLWGGDLNSDERMDDVRGFSGGNRRIREIWRDAGAVSVRARFEPEPQQTYFKRGALRNELDHLFVDGVTLSKVAEWRIDPLPATTLALSDHAPIWLNVSPETERHPSTD